MDSVIFSSYLIEDRSYVSFIKREIHNLIKPFFNDVRTAEIDIVVSELCSNLIKYAGTGEVLYRMISKGEEPAFEIIVIDSGPGIKDVHSSMKDGISSTNTLGHGLGAIKRLSDLNQLYSIPGWGTIQYCRFGKNADRNINNKLNVQCIQVSKPGEFVCGDGWGIKDFNDYSLLFCGDGLGHGKLAKEAVDAALKEFKSNDSVDAAETLRAISVAVKKTRGLVGTVAILDHVKKSWEICGIGNIQTRILKGLEYKNYISNNGIIGLNIPGRLENYNFNKEKFQLLICCSDGIKTRWDLLRYPSILKYDPMMIAAVLYKDHARKNDDMTILVAKVI